jgi:hypothetical protein
MDEVEWPGFIWLGIDTSECSSEYGKEHLGSLKCGKFFTIGF